MSTTATLLAALAALASSSLGADVPAPLTVYGAAPVREAISVTVGDVEPVATDAAAAEGAEPPLVADRPDFTESTEVVPPGRIQLEGGYTFARVGDVDSHALGELLARIPLHRRVELRLGLNSYVMVRPPASAADHSGLEDSSLGVKWKLVDGDPETGLDRPDVALLVSATLPTGDDRLGEDELQPDVVLATAWNLTERISLGTNLGYASAVDGDDRYDQGFGSVAVGFGVGERLGTFLEYFGFFPGSADGSDLHFVDGGVTWLVDDGLLLDARVGKGVNGIEDDFFLGAGATVRF